jgi:hypothetical protein
MKLGIAIPALNEEDNSESIIKERSIERSLAAQRYIAQRYIKEHSSVAEVEVTVVA